MWMRASGPGIGDAIFLSAVAHEIKKQTGEFVGLACEHRELYDNNPDVDRVAGIVQEIRCAPDESWNRVAQNHEPLCFPELHDQGSIQEHNVQFMCRKYGIKPPAWEDLRQYMYLKDEELIDGSDYITISTGTSAFTPNKLWFGFENLVRLLRKHFKVYQLAGPKEEELDCDKVLHLPLRKVAAYIKNALLHICCVTGTMHIASAVGTRSVVIFGGRERAKITGYHNNINIETSPPQGCAPCWLVQPCPHGVHRDGKFIKPCLDMMITPERVYQQVRNALGSEPSSFPASGRYPLLL